MPRPLCLKLRFTSSVHPTPTVTNSKTFEATGRPGSCLQGVYANCPPATCWRTSARLWNRDQHPSPRCAVTRYWDNIEPSQGRSLKDLIFENTNSSSRFPCLRRSRHCQEPMYHRWSRLNLKPDGRVRINTWIQLFPDHRENNKSGTNELMQKAWWPPLHLIVLIAQFKHFTPS